MGGAPGEAVSADGMGSASWMAIASWMASAAFVVMVHACEVGSPCAKATSAFSMQTAFLTLTYVSWRGNGACRPAVLSTARVGHAPCRGHLDRATLRGGRRHLDRASPRGGLRHRRAKQSGAGHAGSATSGVATGVAGMRSAFSKDCVASKGCAVSWTPSACPVAVAMGSVCVAANASCSAIASWMATVSSTYHACHHLGMLNGAASQSGTVCATLHASGMETVASRRTSCPSTAFAASSRQSGSCSWLVTVTFASSHLPPPSRAWRRRLLLQPSSREPPLLPSSRA